MFDYLKLKQLRIKKKLTRDHAHKALFNAGLDISLPTLYAWEAGKSEPDASALFILSKFYGVDPSFFLKK